MSAGLRDADTFSSAISQAEPLPGFILNMDPPDHTRLRALVAGAFTPRAIKAAEPRVAEVVSATLGRVLASGGGDLVGDVASPCTIAVIAAVLGIPVSQAAQVREWTSQSIAYLGQLLRGVLGEADAGGHRALLALVGAALDAAADDDGDTVAANLARLRRDGEMTPEEACGFACLLFTAGHETTTILTGAAFDVLLSEPHLLAALREPEAAREFLEELLRLRPSVHRVTRRARRDTSICGFHVPAGSSVRFLVGSANRDERRFADAETFDPQRRAASVATFGYGAHMCIGSWLARMELRLILEAIGRTVEVLAADPAIPRLPLVGGAFATAGARQLGARMTARTA